MRRQRVPFDWTVGDNVSADDKSLREKAEEAAEAYRAMGAGGLEMAALGMLPDGVDGSMLCVVS